MTHGTTKARNLRLVEKTDHLNEEVKTLALNLAIYLAKKSKDSEDLSRLEPDFIRLVNGTVKVVQELAVIIKAARNQETIAWDAANLKGKEDMLEMRLRSILEQCGRIMQSLGPHVVDHPESA